MDEKCDLNENRLKNMENVSYVISILFPIVKLSF